MAIKGGELKNAKWHFPSHMDRRKSATKFLYVNTLSGKVIRRDYRLFKRAKMVGVGRPLLPEMSAHRLQKRRISVDFCS